MKYLQDISIKGKKVLVRADLNVSLDSKNKVSDENRIRKFLPTLTHVLNHGASAIVMSHLGKPGGKVDEKTSLKAIAEHLSGLIENEVLFAPDCVGTQIEKMASELNPGQVLVLENLRFHPEEKTNDSHFASRLARLGTIYVNDAFGAAHREHASIVSVPKYMQEKAAGFLMQKEIEYFEKALNNPQRPLCVIFGGAKLSTKFSALVNIAEKADKVIIGGAMANTFLAAQGLQMGRSLYEPELFPKVIDLLGRLARKDCKVYFPVDFVVAPSPKSVGLGRPVPAQEIPADTMALDIGPATSLLYKEAIQTSGTILWNGPMGASEHEEFATGTTDMIESIAAAHGMSVVGGGDTDSAIHEMELEHKFSYISTGGGAFLALLEGKELPAVLALD